MGYHALVRGERDTIRDDRCLDWIGHGADPI